MIEFTKNLLKYRVRKKDKSDLEFDESTPFFSANTDKVYSDNEIINRYSKKISFFVFILTGLLLAQTFKMQIIDRGKFLLLAENNRIKEITLPADRGVIYDKKGNILVKNEAIFDLVATPKELPSDQNELNKLINILSAFTARDPGEISKKLEKFNRSSVHPELFLENIDVTSAIGIETSREKLPGIQIRRNAIRNYPDAKYFSQLVGYTGRVTADDLKLNGEYESADFIGKDGLEVFYEDQLKGKRGIQKAEVDAGGNTISILNNTNIEEGKNLILAIDGDLQKKLQDLLEVEMKKSRNVNNKGGAVGIALDPRNGKVLALVSLPTYDNNKFANPAAKEDRVKVLNDSASPLMNRAIGGTYPPGSTIKPVMSIAALKEGIVKENTIIEDTGVINVYYHDLVTHFYGWSRTGLGPMNVISAIAQSSDIYFYTVGGGFGKINGLGVDKIGEYFEKFNLGKKLGIDLPGEVEGLVPTKEWKLSKIGEEWNLGNTYHLSIGQGYLLVTPLQIASWTEVMANSGTLFKPQIVDKIISADTGEIYKNFTPIVIDNNIVEKKYIEIARRGMREAVLKGSARALSSLSVPVAGKTGTAQYGTKGLTHSWFTAFAPYDNPEIVLTILIEGGGEGSSTAVPIAKEILDWYFKNGQTAI